MSYVDTFITVSPDCPVTGAVIPSDKKERKSKPFIEYDLLSENPYAYTGDDLIYEVYLRHKSISEDERSSRGTQIRDELFQKPHPCMRASMLPKKYGWGVHYNSEVKIAIYGVDSAEYLNFIEDSGGQIKLLAAMRNKRAK
ncbi:hypothetical protein SD71_19050 [Cohnella kolymensis]|uniref:Uncharacterized protein n=1 Tax=Cohnella kolymensis TaxID=1590652 RepID=A0ABR5A0G5_9BACL|nr:DUF6157 family protein [Cohnella kolymensis]KIL34564.1 hypothetical protein SD71_19050 [Cohnella kolymensis]